MPIFPQDWSQLFVVETPLIELGLRACLLYVGILAFMRVLPRRTGGEVANMDLIFMLLIAQAAALAFGDYQSVTEALIVIGGLMGLDFLVNFLSFHLPWFERIVSRRAVAIVRDGVKDEDNLAGEFITADELTTHLRMHGLTELKQVKLAMIEGNGKVSIITVSDS